jgi:UDP-N-acetylmuramate dehydrogenase
MPDVRADLGCHSIQAAIDAALDALGPLGERDVPIGVSTTYRVGGAAAVMARVGALADLERVGEAIRVSGLPVVVLGRGSNMLVADDGYPGIVVSATALTDTFAIDVDRAQVRAGSSVPLPILARQCAARGLTGFEWAVGVPGSIGGAVRMNAGGHGSDIAASLVEVTVSDLLGPHPGRPEVRTASELELRFRGSGLGAADLVIDALLQLAPGSRDTAEAEISDVVAWRRANQPGGQNAGSVFVNPVPGEISAGALIDECGLRGLRLGTAQVSEKHANFIQADDGGSAADVFRLMALVRDRVLEATGYELRSEIRLLGFDHFEFDQQDNG